MYIMDTNRINKRIRKLTQIRELNNIIGCTLALPIADGVIFDDNDGLETDVKSLQKHMAEYNIIYSDDELMIGIMIQSLLDDVQLLECFPTAIIDKTVRESKVFHVGDFDDNPYLRDIKFDECVNGRYKLTYNSYEKYELGMWNTALMVSGVMIPRIATFDHRFTYPCITENDATWMSITPNEIFTMQPAIDEAHGNVLTLGCGMGYFAYMVALKDNVSKVTIIEKSPEVIELFTQYILPQFSVKDKIEIIQADAFEYMANLEDGVYDYCFADIWMGNNDTIPYLRLKKLCGRFEHMQTSYWIEDAMVSTIMGYVFILILEEFCKNGNIAAPAKDLSNEEQYILDTLRETLRDVRITKPEDVDYYMDYRNIINLL